MKERPILFSEPVKREPQGCFRAGVHRLWRDKGGRKAAQDRYRATHAEAIRERKRLAYQKDPEKHAERSRQWRKDNPEKWRELMRQSNRRQRDRLRTEMFAAYGNSCSCCGESELLFLDLDHINNDGALDRQVNGCGVKLLGRLKKAGWPKDQYQLLCSNCNQGKQRNGGICPHQQ